MSIYPNDTMLTTTAKDLSRAFATVANHVRPAVVSVFSEKVVKYRSQDFFFPFEDDLLGQFFGEQPIDFSRSKRKGREYSLPLKGMGSGLLLDNNGHILTNYHVVGNVDRIKVQLANRQTFRAKFTQADAKTDIAIIQIEGDFPKDAPRLKFADSDSLLVGDLVIAVGAPFGLPQTVTQGIISAIGRSNVGIETYENFIQTDAPINPGNSGGPLVNMNGEIIGINTAIASSGPAQYSGVGFAVPSNLITTMLPKLLRGERIERGRLGVVIQDLHDELARQFAMPENSGVIVADIEDDSAAERAGLKPGDVITKYGNRQISDSSQFRNLVAASLPGTEVNIKLFRNNNKMNLIAKIGIDAPEEPQEVTSYQNSGSFLERIGISVQNIDRRIAESLNVEKGAVITQIHDGSPAQFAGIMPFDVIIEVNRKKIKDVSELKKVLEKAKDQNAALFLIKRNSLGMYIAVQTR